MITENALTCFRQDKPHKGLGQKPLGSFLQNGDGVACDNVGRWGNRDDSNLSYRLGYSNIGLVDNPCIYFPQGNLLGYEADVRFFGNQVGQDSGFKIASESKGAVF